MASPSSPKRGRSNDAGKNPDDAKNARSSRPQPEKPGDAPAPVKPIDPLAKPLDPPVKPLDPLAKPLSLDEFAPVQSAAKGRLSTRRKRILVGVVVGLVVAASAGFAASRLLAPPEQPMQTAEVTQGTFEETVSGKGTLEPVRTTIASPEVEGIVESVNVGEGAAVNEGDVLYTLKNDDLDLAVAQANAQLQSARDALTQANNKLKLARTTPSFSEGQDAQGNPVIVNTQPSQISDAESQVNSAKSALDSAQSTYDAAVAKAEKRTVRANMAGTVLASNITAGTSIASLSSANKPPLQLSDMSKLIVKIPVSEVDIAKVKEGQSAHVTFDAVPDLSVPATVTHIAQTNESSSTAASAGSSATAVRYEVTLQIDAPDERLKSGMTARAEIATTTVENALIVPNAAIVREGGKAYVMKAPEEKAPGASQSEEEDLAESLVEVAVEARDNSQSAVRVVSGTLSAGDRLMVASMDAAGASGSPSATDAGTDAGYEASLAW